MSETDDQSLSYSACDHYEALSAQSPDDRATYGAEDQPISPTRSSFGAVPRARHRARAKDPYPVKRPSLLRPVDDSQEATSSSSDVGQVKKMDTETIVAHKDAEQSQLCMRSLSLEHSKMAEYVSEIRKLKYELEQKDKQLAFLKKENKKKDACVQANYLGITSDTILSEDVIAETVLEVTGPGQQTQTWDGHGLRLTVPYEAVPAGKTISLAIKVLLTGEFDMPENCHVISAIYWIVASDTFDKDVMLHVNHCAIIRTQTQCAYYRFLTGSTDQCQLPYGLHITESGVFAPNSHEASITMRKSAFYTTAFLGGKRVDYESYVAQVFYRPVHGVYVWQLDFVLTQYVPSICSFVQDDYERRGWTSHHEQRLEYGDDSEVITLRISDRHARNDNWEVTPLNPPEITKWDADHVMRKSCAPFCRMAIKWRGESRHVYPDVSCHVDIDGTRESYHFFNIQLPDRVVGLPVYAKGYPVLEEPLEETDLQEVLKSIASIKYVKNLALNLGLRLPVVLDIVNDNPSPDDQKYKTIYYWMKRVGVIRQKEVAHPTWNELAEAVAGENITLAEQIRLTQSQRLEQE